MPFSQCRWVRLGLDNEEAGVALTLRYEHGKNEHVTWRKPIDADYGLHRTAWISG